MWDGENWIDDPGATTDDGGGYYTDNGDGSYSDPDGNIYDDASGEWIGAWNADGTWTDDQGNVFDSNNNPIETIGGDNTGADDIPEISVPSNWIDNQDGTVTDPTSGDIWGINGDYLGNTADAGLGGSAVTYDPDEFGDVFTVNGKWVGNIYGLPAPGSSNATSARGPNNTPGGAYSSGNLGGQNSGGQGQQSSTADLIKQLQQMLSGAKSNNASVNQQAAIANAIKNLQASSGTSSGASKYLLPAAVALLAFAAFSRR